MRWNENIPLLQPEGHLVKNLVWALFLPCFYEPFATFLTLYWMSYMKQKLKAFQDECADFSVDMNSYQDEKHTEMMTSWYSLDAVTLKFAFPLIKRKNNLA